MLSFLLIYFLTYLTTPSRIGLFHFQVIGGDQTWLYFFVLTLCYSIFCYRCMFAFVVFDLVFQYQALKPRDWLGRTCPKCPILCRVGRKTLTQSVILYYSVLILVAHYQLVKEAG